MMKIVAGLLVGIALCAAPAVAQTPPSVSITLKPASKVEGSRFLATFKRSGDLSASSSVRWTVTGAVDGADFGRTAIPAGTINFIPGQAQKGFWLWTAQDAGFEYDEIFQIVLSAPQNATIAAGKASAAIVNDDTPPRSPLTLINTASSAYWAQEDAFINHIVLTGKDRGLWVKNGWLDPTAQRFVAGPPKGAIKIGPVRSGFVVAAGNFYKGKWILDWQGDGDFTITGGAGTLTRVSTNRIEEDYDPAVHGINAPIVRLTRVGSAGVWNIRYYRASHEPLLAAGEVFDPRWRADMSRYDVIRPMDWTGVKAGREIAAADRPPANAAFYEAQGVPDAVIIRAAIDTGTELWLNAPPLLGCPQSVQTLLRDPAQSLSAGVPAAQAAFDQVMASPEPLNWARQIVAELNRQGYPATRRILIELGNEVWNTNYIVPTNFYSGLGLEVAARHPGLVANMRAGYGYRSAQYAEIFAQALAEGGRSNQVWTMVIGAQSVNPRLTTQALSAVSAFGGTEPMRRFGVATTNYFSGGFHYHAQGSLFGALTDKNTWRQQWLASLAADPVALRQTITNYLISPISIRNSVGFYAANARANQAAAAAVGAPWIGNFEGGSGDFLDIELNQHQAARGLYQQWHESAQHGQVITAIAGETRLIEPSAVMANYIHCAARRTWAAPFAECTPWDQSGGDNAAWDVLLKP